MRFAYFFSKKNIFDKTEKTLLAYRSEKQGHENVIFLFSDTQYTDVLG